MDKKLFAELVIQNERQLYRIAKSILKNDEDCADAAQEAIARGFANLHTLRQTQYAKTWLIRILINECYRIQKANSQDFALIEDGYISSPEDHTAEYSDLYDSLNRLPSERRIVLVLHYLEGYSIKEIADILQLPENTVKSRMARGRRQLKTLLGEDC